MVAQGLWRDRDFLRLWSAQAISELGSRITREGVPLAAALVLGATPVQMGFLAALGATSVLLFAVFAGVWADRVRRRPIMIAADLGRAALLATIPLAAWLHVLGMTLLYVVTALAGVLTVFFDVAYQSYLPSLVDRENVLEGNSKLGLSMAGAEIVGPTLTGILVQTITAPIAILFDAISFLVSAALVGSIRRPETVVQRSGSVSWTEAVAGIHVVLAQPVLRALAGRSATFYFFGGYFGSLYLLYAIRELGMRPAALGVTIAMGGVGYLLGSLAAPRIARRFGAGATFIGSAVVTGLAAILIPLAGGSPLRAMLLLMAQQLLSDSSFGVYTIHEVSLRQSVVEDRLLGRVNAAMQIVARGVLPLGALTGGALGGWIGLRSTMAFAAGGTLLSCLWLVFSPVRHMRTAVY